MRQNNPFVLAFIDFWKEPTPERMPELLHPEVVLRQPLAPPMRGLATAQEEFRRIWTWLPDLRAEVDRWTETDELAFIEFRLHARLGNETVEWPNIDRFTLRDGKATERLTYFDSLPLTWKIAQHPSTWRSWWRSGAARPWRTGLTPMTTARAPRRPCGPGP